MVTEERVISFAERITVNAIRITLRCTFDTYAGYVRYFISYSLPLSRSHCARGRGGRRDEESERERSP